MKLKYFFIVLLLVVIGLTDMHIPAFASDSVLVTDVGSYGDLPTFPILEDIDGYEVGYTLFYYPDESKYVLYCFHYDSNFYACIDQELVSFFWQKSLYRATCLDSDTTWSSLEGGVASRTIPPDYLIYSTVDIYEDSSCGSIYFPQATPSILGMSAEEMTQPMMRELIGVLPLAIGLIIFSMGLSIALVHLKRNLSIV